MAFDNSKYAKRKVKDFNWFRTASFTFFRTLVAIYMYWICRAKVFGESNIPRDHSYFIVASNHVSNLDPFIVGTSIKGVSTAFMAKKELLEDIRTRHLMDSLGVISVDRKKMEIASIRSCKEALKAPGWCLGIFPEGTRVKEGETREVKKGVAFMARAAKSPVLPVAVYHGGEKKNRIIVNIGTLIPYEGQDLDAFTALLMQRIDELTVEAQQQCVKTFGVD